MGYIDITYADSYINPNMETIKGSKIGTLWSSYDDDKKQNYIDYATQKINQIKWVGQKVDIHQTDAFPRLYMEYLKTYRGWGGIGRYGQTTYYTGYYNYLGIDQLMFEELERDEGRVPERVRIAVCLTIIGVMKESEDTLMEMNRKGIPSFSVGGLSFTFRDPSGKTYALPYPAWCQIENLTQYYWSFGDFVKSG